MDQNDPRFDRARVRHLISSPLTALQGAIALLQRRPSITNDAQAIQLTQAIARSTARLRAIYEALLEQFEHESATSGISQAWRALLEQEALAQPAEFIPIVPPLPSAQAVELEGACVLVLAPEAQYSELEPVFTSAGYQLLHTADSLQAVDLARQIQPDVVLIDLQAEAEAIRVTQVLNGDPETRAIPLVVSGVTPEAYGPVAENILLLQAGASALQLLAQVKQALAEARAERPTSVLVVDDAADIRQVLSLALEQAGYRVTTESRGTDALQRAAIQPFDLIILDLVLPDLDGFAVLGALRARQQTAQTPIILLSALNAPSEKVQGLLLGADDYVTKPFSFPELEARLRSALRRREQDSAANPTTRLPGVSVIERAIQQRIEQGLKFAVCYTDIDNFKAYNDTYGFQKGNSVIHLTSRILVEAVRQHGNGDDLVGHIGGDDFVLITTPERIEAICSDAIRRFDSTVPLLYDPQTRARGYIDALDRQGNPTRFAFLSITIAVVTNTRHALIHPADVGDRSAEIKKQGKAYAGSIYLIDGQPQPTPPMLPTVS